MGWAGVGSLVATAGYYLYRYPPRSWNPEPRSATPEPKSDAPPAAPAPAAEYSQEKHGAGAGESTVPSLEIEEDESQTTPKASASQPPPGALAVPALTLDEDTSDLVASEVNPVQNMSPPTERSSLARRDNATPKTDSPQPPSPSRPPPQQSRARPANSAAPTSSLMPPPPIPRPRPTSQVQPPRVNGRSSLRPPPSAAASQRGPPGSGGGLSSSTLAPTPLTLNKQKSAASRKVILEPGFSPLDWAVRTANPNNQLRGAGLPPGLLRVTPSMLKTQNGRKGRDAWTSYQGKVYNISPYLPYHPGGKGELLRGAGKDSAKLFQEIHPWVNWDGILGECLVGILVSENDAQSAESSLDAMD